MEHAYQACKSLSLTDWLDISKLPTPGKAKRAGRTLLIRPDWEQVKIGIMKDLLVLKFSQDDLKELLLSTRPNVLIEGNLWQDQYWGVCYCDKCKGKGQNHLGKLLMEVRDKL